ncbi:glycosyltransferase, partial [Singulisphaera rosea]
MMQGRDLRVDSLIPLRNSELRRPLRVALVGHEFLGPGRGVVGKALARLVGSLEAAGHEVMILDTSPPPGTVGGGDALHLGQTPRVVPLPDCGFDLHGETPNMAISHRVASWLREHDDFDVVHFVEAQGHGYYTALAKHQGTILRDATLVVGLQGATAWAHSADGQFPQSEKDLEEMYIERRSAELADVVWSPSGS